MGRVLVACEESQIITKAFRALGHEAYSCDLQDCSGGHPEWHFKQDALILLEEDWDLVIAHPPCTYLAMSSASWMYNGYSLNQERYEKALKARDFFMEFLNCNCERVCVENPTPLRIVKLPEKSQSIHPYHFGDPFSKRTYLWLKNLPLLKHTNVVKDYVAYIDGGARGLKSKAILAERYARSPKERSKTFPGIAKAMAEQWGPLLP